MSARIARDVGAWLSATESPWHSGHFSSDSSDRARSAAVGLPPGQSRMASTTATIAPSATHGAPLPDEPVVRHRGSAGGARVRQERVELGHAHHRVLRRHDLARG